MVADNAVSGAVVVSNLGEFLADLKQVESRFQNQIKGTLRNSAGRVLARSRAYAPSRSGALNDRTSIRLNKWSIKIFWLAIYAGVQEFAHDYERTRGGITSSVHMTGETPRFAYRAWEEMEPAFGEELLDDLAEAIKATGWWHDA